MELRYEITGQQRDTALSALSSLGQRDAARLMIAMTGGAALSLLWPFGPDLHGALRCALGALLAGGGFLLAHGLVQFAQRYGRYRAGLPLEPDYLRGSEPGPRRVTLTLDGIREKGPFGIRDIRWSEVEEIVERDGLAAFCLARGECVVLPSQALARAGHGDLSVIEALVRSARLRHGLD